MIKKNPFRCESKLWKNTIIKVLLQIKFLEIPIFPLKPCLKLSYINMGSTCSGCMSSEPVNAQPHPISNRKNLINEEEKVPQNLSNASVSGRRHEKIPFKKKNIEKVQEAPNAKVIARVKSESELDLILSAINSHFILKNLDDPCKHLIIDSMKSYALDSRQAVYEQGRSGECFFIVSSGRLEVIQDRNRISTLGPGDSFGELSLVDDRPRSETIRTIEKTLLWGIDRNTYKRSIESYSSMVFKEILDFVSEIPIFSPLSLDQKHTLVAEFSTHLFAKGEKIINEGDPGDTLHIIKHGEVAVLQNQSLLRNMGQGCYYGEQALINNCTRTASILAITDCVIMIIQRSSLIEALGTGIEEIIFRNTIKISLEKSLMFKDLSSLPQIIDAMKIKKYNTGDVVFKKGAKKARKLFVVVRGKLKLGQELLEPYHILGENEMKRNSLDKFTEKAVAEADCVVAEINKKSLEKCMDAKISKFSDVNELLLVLKKVSLFRYLTTENLKMIVKVIREQAFADGSCIITQGEIGDKLFIIKTGSVSIVKNNEVVRSLYADNYFGERAIVFNETRSATVMAVGPVSCWVLLKADFNSIVDEKMNRALIKRIELQDDAITLNDLIPVKCIGKGMYGNVFLCLHKDKKVLYALKSVTRQKIEAYEIYENMLLEKNILMTLDHLMIVKLVKTFKDNLRVYFLMEFIKGIDLFDLQGKLTVLSVEDAKFYSASLVLILEFLHSNDIIYRDLKPENIIIDDEGYVKLVDFGSSKIVKGKTYTTLGSPHYMAPEIMLGTGYTNSVDWWSLGILLFEWLEGNVPFGGDEEDPVAVYKKVVEHNLVFFHVITQDTKSIISQFLSVKPGARNSGNLQKLKKNPFFSEAKWEQILSRQFKPKYTPKVYDPAAEISRALIARKVLKEFINREESQDGIFRQNSKPVVNYNWDINF